MRLILVGQDLSGQTIEGQPFSYIGRCTGTDVKFIGDWTHASFYGNEFLRPDCGEAKMRWFYGREDTLTDPILPKDIETLDHEMMLALMKQAPVTGLAKSEADKVVAAMEKDMAAGKYLISFVNVTADYIDALGANAESAFRQTVGDREYVVKRMLNAAGSDPKQSTWTGLVEPHVETEGIDATEWGIMALARDGRQYLRHFSELPQPKNPHDRVEAAELYEAEILKATGLVCTFYMQSLTPFRPMVRPDAVPRDWWVK